MYPLWKRISDLHREVQAKFDAREMTVEEAEEISGELEDFNNSGHYYVIVLDGREPDRRN